MESDPYLQQANQLQSKISLGERNGEVWFHVWMVKPNTPFAFSFERRLAKLRVKKATEQRLLLSSFPYTLDIDFTPLERGLEHVKVHKYLGQKYWLACEEGQISSKAKRKLYEEARGRLPQEVEGHVKARGLFYEQKRLLQDRSSVWTFLLMSTMLFQAIFLLFGQENVTSRLLSCFVGAFGLYLVRAGLFKLTFDIRGYYMPANGTWRQRLLRNFWILIGLGLVGGSWHFGIGTIRSFLQ